MTRSRRARVHGCWARCGENGETESGLLARYWLRHGRCAHARPISRKPVRTVGPGVYARTLLATTNMRRRACASNLGKKCRNRLSVTRESLAFDLNHSVWIATITLCYHNTIVFWWRTNTNILSNTVTIDSLRTDRRFYCCSDIGNESGRFDRGFSMYDQRTPFGKI